MKMVNNPKSLSWVWPGKQAEKSRGYYFNRLRRIESIRNNRRINTKQSHKKESIQQYIKDAIARETKKYKKIKEYGQK